MFKYLINNAVREAKMELMESLRTEIRNITKSICMEMVKELFNSDEDKEGHLMWGSRFYADTVVGKLKSGIAKKVASDFTVKQQGIARHYISSEEFIDTVIDRIKKKQLPYLTSSE